jgi:ABC-type multidrug transport system fused ATPase/permease subunit
MVEVGKMRAAFDPIIEALPNIGILAVLVVGAWRVDQGVLTAGTLVTFAYLFRLVALPMSVFGWLLGELPRSVVGLHRVEAVLDAQERVSYGMTRPDARGGAGASAVSIAYAYPESDYEDLGSTSPRPGSAALIEEGRGIQPVTLGRPWTYIALVGPTGAGKSTVAHLLVRLFDPDTGEICLDGHTLVDLDRDSLARSVAIVFQETFLSAIFHSRASLCDDGSSLPPTAQVTGS